jgi:hypothetical protein
MGILLGVCLLPSLRYPGSMPDNAELDQLKTLVEQLANKVNAC